MKTLLLVLVLLVAGAASAAAGMAATALALIWATAGFVAGVAYVAWRETAHRLDDAQRHADATVWDGGPR